MVRSVYVMLNMEINEKIVLHVDRQVGSRNAGRALLVIPAGDGGIAAMSCGTGLVDVQGRQASEPAAPAPSRPSDVGR